MKSYSLCSLVLFQIVSTHGSLHQNLAICNAKENGYIGRRAEHNFFSESGYSEDTEPACRGHRFFLHATSRHDLFSDSCLNISKCNILYRQHYEADLHMLIFLRKPALVLQDEH